MTKLFDRLSLFSSSWHPAEFYLHVLPWLAVTAAILFLPAMARRVRKLPLIFSFLALPVFLSLLSFFGSILICGFGRVNVPVCGMAVLQAATGMIFFVELISDQENLEGLHSFSWIFSLELVVLAVFYLLSVDHNYVPPQFDGTTYQFIGELLYRKGTYPMVSFVGGETLSILVPPGYYSLDFWGRVLWNDPRVMLIIACLLLISLTIAFAGLASVLFSDKKLPPFIGAAVFCRGVLWNFWEFNLLRQLSVVCGILFLMSAILFIRAESNRRRWAHLIFAQAFLAAGLVAHPENLAYILFGVFAYAGFRVLFSLGDPLVRHRTGQFLVSMILPISVFSLWFLKSANQSAGRSLVLTPYQLPIPEPIHFIFHTNGVLPIIFLVMGIVFMLMKKETIPLGKFFGFLFVWLLVSSYYSLGLHLISPASFPMKRVAYDDFVGAVWYVKSFLMHPHALIIKISGFWWVAVLVMGWFFSKLWDVGRHRLMRAAMVIGVGGLMMLDIAVLYFNQPIISIGEYTFLRELKSHLPADAVVVAPPGYYFSAWVGPLLERDSLSFRGAQHTLNSIAKSLPTEIETAYVTGDFGFFKTRLPQQKLTYLFIPPYLDLAERLSNQPGVQVLLRKEGVVALTNL